MARIDFSKIDLYDWVPFFRELSKKIAELNNESYPNSILREKARLCFGDDCYLYLYDKADPLSFIYYLAQRNGTNRWNEIISNIKDVFQLESKIPTDLIFPTPPNNAPVGFYSDKPYEPEYFWRIFTKAVNDSEIDDEQFRIILSFKNIGIAKLTQVLFLINPLKYLPIDDRIFVLPVPINNNKRQVEKNILDSGIEYYKELIDTYKSSFPGVQLYEINLFGYLIFSGQLKINEEFYQIGSNVYGETDKEKGDHKLEFYEQNGVWVGGPRGGKGVKEYPLSDPNKGDVILSHFNHIGNGVGIVLHNEYADNNGFAENLKIKVIWINKEERKGALNPRRMMGFSKAESVRKSFQDKYKETFNIIFRLNENLYKMEIINNDTVKNLIIQGAPGTGKTRLAKQLGLYLTQNSDNKLSTFLVNDTIRENDPIFHTEPAIAEDNEQMNLVLFHPGYNYEDFVRGIVTTIYEGSIQYKVQDKIFMNLVDNAKKRPEEKFILIIDEMNRANLPAVLGELIYGLEYRDQPIQSLYKDETSQSNIISIPNNLYVIGTMNTADRSVGHIDYAIRRRFLFKELESDIRYVSEDAKNCYSKVEDLFKQDAYLSPDFDPKDVMIGHSYFMTDNVPLSQRLELEIKPILREYVKDGILMGEDILNKIDQIG